MGKYDELIERLECNANNENLCAHAWTMKEAARALRAQQQKIVKLNIGLRDTTVVAFRAQERIEELERVIAERSGRPS